MGLTNNEFEIFLDVGMGICALMILVSLARYRSRGVNSLLLAGAFAAMGGVLYALKGSLPQIVVVVLGVIVGVCLLADFGIRSAKQQDKR